MFAEKKTLLRILLSKYTGRLYVIVLPCNSTGFDVGSIAEIIPLLERGLINDEATKNDYQHLNFCFCLDFVI